MGVHVELGPEWDREGWEGYVIPMDSLEFLEILRICHMRCDFVHTFRVPLIGTRNVIRLTVQQKTLCIII